MGVASGCGCKEVYRFLIQLIPTPLVSVLFCSSIIISHAIIIRRYECHLKDTCRYCYHHIS